MKVYALMLYGTDEEVQSFLLSLWERHPYSIVHVFDSIDIPSDMFLGYIETAVPIEFSEIAALCNSSCPSLQAAGFTEMEAATAKFLQ